MSCQAHITFDIELLEARQLLAGTVTTFVNGSGDLIVNGDGEDNDFIMTLGMNGAVMFSTFEGTIINEVDTAVVSRNIIINLRGGDDRFELWGLADSNIAGMEQVKVNGGSGDDYVRLFQLDYPTHNSLVNGGSGNDELVIEHVRTIGDFKMIGGGGDDQISIDHLDVADNDFLGWEGAFQIQAGGGDDTIGIEDLDAVGLVAVLGGGDDQLNLATSTITGNATISGGGNHDTIGIVGTALPDTHIALGAGDDSFSMVDSATKYGPDVSVSAAGGNDSVELLNATIAGQADISTGAGHDQVAVVDSSTGSVDVSTGGGADEITTESSDLGMVHIVTAGGNDFLQWSETTGIGSASGGGGQDRFDAYSCFTPLTHSGFENYNLIDANGSC
jgi:hypothetical protein